MVCCGECVAWKHFLRREVQSGMDKRNGIHGGVGWGLRNPEKKKRSITDDTDYMKVLI